LRNSNQQAISSTGNVFRFPSALTPRESTIARMAAEGQPCKKIAGQLNISEKTVRNQLTIIYSKLGVSSQMDLVVRASSINV
jgi:DNA-binding NarL/FixJ family response regulator